MVEKTNTCFKKILIFIKILCFHVYFSWFAPFQGRLIKWINAIVMSTVRSISLSKHAIALGLGVHTGPLHLFLPLLHLLHLCKHGWRWELKIQHSQWTPARRADRSSLPLSLGPRDQKTFESQCCGVKPIVSVRIEVNPAVLARPQPPDPDT